MNTRHTIPCIEAGIFSRTPERGRVKKRLAVDVGDEEALRVYEELFRSTLRAVTDAGSRDPAICPVLWYAGNHPADFLPPSFPFDVLPQPASDFGANLQVVMDRIERNDVRGTMVIGTDHPTLSAAHIMKMAALTAKHQVSIAPSEDGGFWCMGTSIPLPGIYDDMTFSTPTVFQELMARFQSRGLDVGVGPTLWDIDTQSDLERWNAQKR